ncbi:MAG TPA: hypothetical protein DDW65_05710, partial [Firmicutes bacterium]|nr:hypothetical protein [Bacillota bacterium]
LSEKVALRTDAQQETAVTQLLPGKSFKSFKVTELLVFKDCARKYFWQYEWGLNDDREEIYSEKSEKGSGNRDSSGTKIGSFLHQVFQAGDAEWPEVLWKETFQGLAAAESSHLKADLQQMWGNFRNSRFTKEHGKCWDEVPFILKMANRKIEGRFDRLIQSRDGILTLVDYKSHHISGGEVEKKARPYFWQLQLYALAIEALWGRLPDQALLYFLYPNQTVAVPLDEASLNETRRDVQNIMQFIEEHDQYRRQDYARGKQCKYCGYKGVCG